MPGMSGAAFGVAAVLSPLWNPDGWSGGTSSDQSNPVAGGDVPPWSKQTKLHYSCGDLGPLAAVCNRNSSRSYFLHLFNSVGFGTLSALRNDFVSRHPQLFPFAQNS